MALDEFEVIGRYFAGLTRPRDDVRLGIGDDAAVLALPPGQELVASTDTLVSGVHFAADAVPFDIGFKSLAVNLSDMAAMGAEPRWTTLALTLPHADPEWLQAFADGFGTSANRHHVSLVGGDLTRGLLSITVQILGSVPTGTAVRRSTARAGDLIYVTGELGSAGLALAVLAGNSIDRSAVPASCFERLLRPEPRLSAGQALRGVASAAIDLSDGLAADLDHVVRQSGAGAVVRLDAVPINPALAAVRDQDHRWRIAIGTGDDYELCFTVPPDRRDAMLHALQAIGQPVTHIGEITSGSGIRWLLSDGREYHPSAVGFRHF